jgi:hypothetical protein
VLEVCVIKGRDQHTPEPTWTPFRGWMQPPSHSELQSARLAALRDPRYFGACSICNERLPAGHMHDARFCCACAQEHLGLFIERVSRHRRPADHVSQRARTRRSLRA